jgi:hypothetical protein
MAGQLAAGRGGGQAGHVDLAAVLHPEPLLATLVLDDKAAARRWGERDVGRHGACGMQDQQGGQGRDDPGGMEAGGLVHGAQWWARGGILWSSGLPGKHAGVVVLLTMKH